VIRWLLFLTLTLLWAPSFLLIKIGLEEIPPLAIATSRLGIAALILFVILRARGGGLPREGKTWRALAYMAFFGSALPFAAISVGEQYTDSALASIFNGATPIATSILAHFFLEEEKMTPVKLLGIIVGFIGIVSIFLPAIGTGGGSLLGLSAFLLAALCYGISMVHARLNLRGLPSLVAPTLQLGLGALMLLPFTLAFEWNRLTIPGGAPLISILFLGVMGTGLAYIVYYALLERGSATFLSLVTYFLPPSGVFLGMAVRGERPGWNAFFGCALIIVGIVLVNIAPFVTRRCCHSQYEASRVPKNHESGSPYE